MKILLDTCTFLWLLSDDAKLSSKVKKLVVDLDNDLFLSPISLWEINVKNKKGNLSLPDEILHNLIDVREEMSITSLPLVDEHVVLNHKLPDLHKDIFDRLLICQSISSSIPIATNDKLITQYPVKVIW